jgi:putative oxidoreductase
MSPLIAFARRKYPLFLWGTTFAQDAFLLLIRLYWGWQFFITGKGKLQNIGQITEFFQGLNIPFPQANAYVVGSLECFGGLLLVVGLAARLTALPLSITLCVAYATADYEALATIFANDNSEFLKSTPLTFLFVTLTVVCFGPGRASLDALVAKLWLRPDEKH